MISKNSKIAFITESLNGNHMPLPFVAEVFVISANFVSLDGRSFYVPKSFTDPIRDYGPDIIVYGTDYDLQGQLIASCLKYALPEFLSVRMPFCDDGYLLIGDFYSKEQMEDLAKFSFIEKSLLARIEKNGLPSRFKAGITKCIALDTLLLSKNDGVENINPSGTSTITVMVKAELLEG